MVAAKALVRNRHHVDGGRAPLSPNDDSFHPVMWRAIAVPEFRCQAFDT